MSNPLNLAVIVGSTRQGRVSPMVTRWFAQRANEHAEFTVDVIDLAEVALPDTLVENESDIPQAVLDYGKRIGKADAVVVVVPEYNHSFPAPLKTGIDWLYSEWAAKPISFVSYGGVSGGLRAVEQLRLVFAELNAVAIRDTVCFPNFWESFDDEGNIIDPTLCDKSAATMLDQLSWWAHALRNHRSAHPFANE
ncbi:NADPH-dependent FMN reductase [Natronoglycomyces albus]|uniref:NAD(P)H-dependent oxidoreductase n=1 Tax=Natronoglycomyces albus TaxID=2811108 RepID=A0A895XM42_9ACTN|nr:NAD(P)H-dependent oxidoreductase [Natronoglycomyces albus]QSB04045.1 NAD(P)H-dependent oxidoreductase [Natronoglycomyces albus]